MGRTILKLHPASGGQILYDGQDITDYSKTQMRSLRTEMQIIFQDPYSSLPPRATVGDILSEPVRVHRIVPPSQVKEYVIDLMEQCGLRDYYYERYPHEFSGGQRQRICIARALSVNPKLVVCDEPVSALDVSIQAQIINLLKKLQKERGLTYLFISHDLSVVKFISDKIGVMYLGNMVEFGAKKDSFGNPLHPYTRALYQSIPSLDKDVERLHVIPGMVSDPSNLPPYCSFFERCDEKCDRCRDFEPWAVDVDPGHVVRCLQYTPEWNGGEK
jgi:peptide/nickel transport system ATP-binding protein